MVVGNRKLFRNGVVGSDLQVKSGKPGNRKYPDTALSELIAKYQTDDAFQIATAYAFRHEPEKAFEWLDRAYVQHDTGLAATKLESLLQNLRGDPRYIAFLKKLRLPL